MVRSTSQWAAIETSLPSSFDAVDRDQVGVGEGAVLERRC